MSTTEESPTTTPEGRESNGRFAKGNHGGPGNPYARQVAQLRLRALDIVAVGEHWGEGTFTKGARAGRAPLGVCFELSPGTEPADRIPPQAAREVQAYFAAR